jgi:hypothetical protein
VTGLNIRAVIYGTDFTVCSQNAGLYAAYLARFFAAKLLVTHAFTLSQAAMEVEIDGSLMSQQRKDLEVLLEQKALASGVEAVPCCWMVIRKRCCPGWRRSMLRHYWSWEPMAEVGWSVKLLGRLRNESFYRAGGLR